MAFPRRRAVPIPVVIVVVCCAVAYAVFFCMYSLLRYNAFLMHALDMGNLDQAVWFTLHGQPFHFNDMRLPIDVEAFGTDTRLSFHVEPILLPLSLLYLIAARPETLLLFQTLVLASGAIPAMRLAYRRLQHPLAAIVFPLTYLLFPALQAANLYEFHPVTLVGALLLWAIDCADARRYGWFVVFAIASAACKEEIGLSVGLLGLWIALRRGGGTNERLLGITTLVLGTVWSLFCIFIVVPHFQPSHAASLQSPYWTRYLDPTKTVPGDYVQVTGKDVLLAWLKDPHQFVLNLVTPPKLGFLHRLLIPDAYLALLAPITAAIALPGLAIIMLSQDQHMYGGLGHYSAELVPVVVVASIIGLDHLARLISWLGARRSWTLGMGSMAVLVLALINQRENGFTPLAANFALPAITPHVRLGQRLLAMIPAQASVSAQDTLVPHLGDRAGIYLFPDYAQASYIALDASASAIPGSPHTDEQIVQRLLDSGGWSIVAADDGYLILHRLSTLPTAGHAATPAVRTTTLPPQFYSFVLDPHPAPQHRILVQAGPSLRLVGYDITRREDVNLRVPDVLLTTYWQVERPLPASPALTVTSYLTGLNGLPRNVFVDHAGVDWYPMLRWRPGQTIKLTSLSMGVGVTRPGIIHPGIAVRGPTAGLMEAAGRLHLQVIRSDGTTQLEEQGTFLSLAPIQVVF